MRDKKFLVLWIISMLGFSILAVNVVKAGDITGLPALLIGLLAGLLANLVASFARVVLFPEEE